MWKMLDEESSGDETQPPVRKLEPSELAGESDRKRPRRAPSFAAIPQDCTSWVASIRDAFEGLWDMTLQQPISLDTLCSGLGTPSLVLEACFRVAQQG